MSGLVLGQRPLGAVLHSSNEPGELSQWLCHDDSTINIVLDIIIIILQLHCFRCVVAIVVTETTKLVLSQFKELLSQSIENRIRSVSIENN